jgi:hypothetical protein
MIRDSISLSGPPYAGLWALKMWAGPRGPVMHQQLRTKITLKNENPWIFAKVTWMYISVVLSIVVVFI